jgi:hypothetical protein
MLELQALCKINQILLGPSLQYIVHQRRPLGAIREDEDRPESNRHGLARDKLAQKGVSLELQQERTSLQNVQNVFFSLLAVTIVHAFMGGGQT